MMSETFNEFIAGGYYFSKPEPRDSGRSDDLLPEMLLSFSGHICSHLPDYWMFDNYDLPEFQFLNAQDDGFSHENAAAVIAWTMEQYRRGNIDYFQCTFNSLEIAREFKTSFLPKESEYQLYGLGLHKSLAQGFLVKGKPEDVPDIHDTEHSCGLYHKIQLGNPLAPGGEAMGFDLLALDPLTNNLGCSWLCNGLERKFHERLGLRPNHLGLINKLEDAARCAKILEDKEVGAEPGLWLPWLIVRY
jgi:hypothetical protein